MLTGHPISSFGENVPRLVHLTINLRVRVELTQAHRAFLTRKQKIASIVRPLGQNRTPDESIDGLYDSYSSGSIQFALARTHKPTQGTGTCSRREAAACRLAVLSPTPSRMNTTHKRKDCLTWRDPTIMSVGRADVRDAFYFRTCDAAHSRLHTNAAAAEAFLHDDDKGMDIYGRGGIGVNARAPAKQSLQERD